MSSPIKVSVVISTRDEGSNLAHTCHAIINDLETFLKPDEFELILVHNNPTDSMGYRYLMERGMFNYRTIRVLFDPIAGNVTARNKGAKLAKGKYLFFSDAHMSYRIGSFKAMINALDEYGGMVHPSVQWMGGYDPSGRNYQYSIKLGEKIWGTWNNRIVGDGTKPFYIPICGHCCLGVLREQFEQFEGYNDYFRCYGGGEVYLDIKWWMLGSTVMCVPSAVGYHLSAGRGYNFYQNDLIHNMMLLGYALGADAMAERVYLRYLAKQGVSNETLLALHTQALDEARHDREILLPKTTKSFYDCITDRSWDAKNMELHGKANSGILIYDRTWTTTLTDEARALFDASPLQAELQKRIDSEWSHLVYQGIA